MKKNLTVLAGLLLMMGMNAQNIKYDILKVDRSPIIDGLQDPVWEQVEEIFSFYPIREKEWEIAPDDSSDCSPTFKLLWDDAYLYVYMETYDDILHKDAIGLGIEQSIGNNDDCFEIYIDGDYSQGESWDGVNDCQLWFLWGETEILTYSSELIPFSTDNIQFKQIKYKNVLGTRKDFGVEVRFPLADIQVPSMAGAIFGLDLRYSDDDGHEVNPGLEGTDREHNMRWSANMDAHPPSSWFAVKLSGEYIDKETGMENERQEGRARLYPNPSSGRISIELPAGLTGDGVIRIYDQAGREVLHYSLKDSDAGATRQELDLETLTEGLYFFRVIKGALLETGKLICQ